MKTYLKVNNQFFDYLLIILCIFYFLKIIIFPLNLEIGGSEIHYIAYFKDYLNTFRNFEFTGLQNERWHYQEWRWGVYVIPIILKIFVSFENAVFLSSPIIIFLSFCLLILSLRKYLNFIFIIFFSIFWIIHPEITKSTYSFSTLSSTFLGISILIYLLSFEKEIISKFGKRPYLIFLILSFFFLYGSRETNIIFFPFLIFYIWKNFERKDFYFLFIFGVSLYLVESFLIGYITNWQFMTGRLFYHLIGDNSWIDFMQNDKLRFGDDAPSIKSFTRKFIDGGIFSRWYFTGLTSNFFYILALIYSVKIFFNERKKNNFEKKISLIYLSYFFCISLVMVKLVPLVPFIHLNVGIQIVGLPFALILFLLFLDEMIKPVKNNIIKFVFVAFIGVLLSLKSLNHFYKVDYKIFVNNNYNLLNMKKHIDKVYKMINESDCISVKGSYIHLIYLSGNQLDKKIKNKLINSIKDNENEYIKKSNSGKFYKIKFNEKCKKIVKLYKFQMIN